MTPATALDITTNTNETYNFSTREEGEGGGRPGIQPRSVLSQQTEFGGSHEYEYVVSATPQLLPNWQGQRGTRAAAGAASGGEGEGEGEGGMGKEEGVYELMSGDN